MIDHIDRSYIDITINEGDSKIHFLCILGDSDIDSDIWLYETVNLKSTC